MLYSDGGHHLPEEQAPFLSDSKPTKSRSCSTYITLGALAISVLVNIIFLLPSNLDAICLQHTSAYNSPITDDITVKYKEVEFDGRFWNSSVYRQPPSREVDDAWLALGAKDRHVIIPEDQPERYGLDPGALKQIPEHGGGYVTLVEVDHHLHCLNMLRKTTWFNYPYYKELGEAEFLDDIDTFITHTTHCIDILRQFIMCNADMTVYGQYWVKDIDRPFVDFNTKHMCKDFDTLTEWIAEHEASDVRVRFREGDVLLDTTP